jgi:hypothetical protein
VTGYHHKSAIRALNAEPITKKRQTRCQFQLTASFSSVNCCTKTPRRQCTSACFQGYKDSRTMLGSATASDLTVRGISANHFTRRRSSS